MGVGRNGSRRLRIALGVACGLAAVLLDRTAGAEVDWGKGLVTGRGVGIADRHAPSPATAREPARRAAEDAAKKAIAAQLGALPLASGGTLAAKLADKAIAARIDRAVAAAITVDATPQTDGAWTVTLAVPIEALRQAIEGERTLGPSGDADPPIVVVDGVGAKPAIGYQVGGVAAATLWVKVAPEWASTVPHVKATGVKAGAVELASKTGGPATLFVLISK